MGKPKTKADIAAALSATYGTPVCKTQMIVSAVFREISCLLETGHAVRMTGIGTIIPRPHSGGRKKNNLSGGYMDVRPWVGLKMTPSGKLISRMSESLLAKSEADRGGANGS